MTRPRGCRIMASLMPAQTDFAARIVSTLGKAPTAQALVSALVPETADSCIVFRRAEHRYSAVAWGHYDPAKTALLDQLAAIYHPDAADGRDPIATVGRSGRGVLVSWVTRANVERATDDPRVHAIYEAFGPRNLVVVPIRDGEYVMVASISDTPRKFIHDDLEFLTDLAARVAPLLP